MMYQSVCRRSQMPLSQVHTLFVHSSSLRRTACESVLLSGCLSHCIITLCRSSASPLGQLSSAWQCNAPRQACTPTLFSCTQPPAAICSVCPSSSCCTSLQKPQVCRKFAATYRMSTEEGLTSRMVCRRLSQSGAHKCGWARFHPVGRIAPLASRSESLSKTCTGR